MLNITVKLHNHLIFSCLLGFLKKIQDLEQQRNLLLNTYFPLLEKFESILRESQSAWRLRFSWIALLGMSAQLGCLGILLGYYGTYHLLSWTSDNHLVKCQTRSKQSIHICFDFLLFVDNLNA